MHETVLLREAVDALVTNPGGFYVDGTFGRGGHSRAILEQLNEGGHLLGVDKDPQAALTAANLEESDPRFSFYHDSFARLQSKFDEMGVTSVTGILLDLGVSSPQLDEASRGFSFLNDGPLDMRMDTSRGETAAQWIANASVEEIASVLKDYGEERFAKRIARAIVEAQSAEPIVTTARLATVGSDTSIRLRVHFRRFVSTLTASSMTWRHCSMVPSSYWRSVAD